MSTKPGDRVLDDPFAGSSTTLITAELKQRRWTGMEIESVAPIVEGYNGIEAEQAVLKGLEGGKDRLFLDEALALREASGHGLGAYPILVEHLTEAHGDSLPTVQVGPIARPVHSEE